MFGDNGGVTVATDGYLPAALDHLHAAVAALVDPVKGMSHGGVLTAPSLYEQLVGDIGAAPSRDFAYARGQGRAKSPVWTDAMDLRIEIDDAVQAWAPDPRLSTPLRLRALASARWRPQDSKRVEQIAGNVESWAVQIRSMLDPQHVKHLSVHCPACGASTVYRRDSAGELVRVPALHLVADQGCTCQACRHTWLPQHYLLLCKVLGFDTPEGVVPE